MHDALRHPLAPLVALSGLTTLVLSAHVWLAAVVSPGVDALLRFAWVLLGTMWVDADARRLRRLPCMDFGLFVAIMYPISILWYCLWSRGWRGVFVLVLLAGLLFGPYTVAELLSALL